MLDHAVMGEQEGLSKHLCGAPVLRISKVEVMFPTFTTLGWPVSKSRTQLHSAGDRPRASSLKLSMEGTKVVKVEQLLINSIHT